MYFSREYEYYVVASYMVHYDADSTHGMTYYLNNHVPPLIEFGNPWKPDLAQQN